MTRGQALALYESEWWVGLPHDALAAFQLFEDRLCMPFGIFHEAVEKTLGRPVFTHEFGSAGGLREEFLGDKPVPTLREILDLIPAEKRILVQL